MIKIYPSDSTFMIGPKPDSYKNNSCPRYLWASRKLDYRPSDIPEEYEALGKLNEARIALVYDDGKIPYEKEVEIKKSILGGQISGRIDFILYPHTDPILVETKATSSKNVRRAVLETKTPDTNHLAQLVTYMMLKNVRQGQLIMSYYETDAARLSFQVVEEHTFVVEVLDNGVLTVDGKVYPRSTKDLARWYKVVSEALTSEEVPEAFPPTDKYKSICRFCPLINVCTKQFTAPEDSAQFLLKCDEEFKRPRPPKKFNINGPPKRNRKRSLTSNHEDNDDDTPQV